MPPAIDKNATVKIWEKLLHSGDFQRAYQQGRKIFTPQLGVFHKPADGPLCRYGVVASYKQVGNAVARNRAKRRLRALARRTLWPQAASCGDYVLVATKLTNRADFQQLEKDLLAALRRLEQRPQ